MVKGGYMDKNKCPYCGEHVSSWKKWQLTDNRYGKRCPNCNNIIVLPVWFVRFVLAFNIAAVIILGAISYSLQNNRTLFLLVAALLLIPVNMLLLRLTAIRKNNK